MYVDDVLASSLWWGRDASVTKVLVVTPQVFDLDDRHAWAVWRCGAPYIAVPEGMFYERVVLHELAHIATSSRNRTPHGGRFVRMYLRLIAARMGSYHADCLRAEMRRQGVCWW